MKYDHKAIEPKWQEKWEEAGVFHAENGSDKPKYYALIEFPSPSGQGLHVGHPRPYTALDVAHRAIGPEPAGEKGQSPTVLAAARRAA